MKPRIRKSLAIGEVMWRYRSGNRDKSVREFIIYDVLTLETIKTTKITISKGFIN